MSRILSVFVVLSFPAFAASRADLVSSAVDGVKEAVEELADAPAACRKKVSSRVEALEDAVRAAKKDPSDATLKAAQRKADQAADVAQEVCTGSTGKRINRALQGASKSLDDALAVKEDSGPPAVLGAIAQGLGGLFAGAVQTSEQTSSKQTSRSSHTEQLNGKDLDSDEPEADEQPKKKKASKEEAPSRFAFGATCRKNAECESNTCFLGTGSVGFCTKMCSDDGDCPNKMFEWSCYRPRNLNAPQKLCLQSKD
jgi:hypothetical protein